MASITLQRYRVDAVDPVVETIAVNFHKAANENEINDGGNDMFDGGNSIYTDYEDNIPYTHSQSGEDSELSDFRMDGTVEDGELYFGEGSQYFTNMYPGMFVLGAKGISINTFGIDGNLGSDGYGTVLAGDFAVNDGDVWRVYYKTVWDEDEDGDPCVNHIIIVRGDGSGISHTWDEEADDDTDQLDGLGDINEIYYVLWATHSHGFSPSQPGEEECLALASQIIEQINSESLADTLNNLNNSWEEIVNSIEFSYVFDDDGTSEMTINCMAYIGLESETFNPKFMAIADTSIYIGESDLDPMVVNFERVGDVSLPLSGIAAFEGYVYGVCPYMPFLIKMDFNGNVLNEVANQKFNIVLYNGVGPLALTALAADSNGLVGQAEDSVLYRVNHETGECTAIETGDKYYNDICGIGRNPPLIDNWFVSNEDVFYLDYSGDESALEDLVIEWNPTGYETYGNPPEDGWQEATFNITEDNIVITSPLVSEVGEQAHFRAKLSSPDSMWVYTYWD